MDKQSIDIKYISGRGIKSPVPFHKPCLFTTVYISSPSNAPRPHRQKTPTDPQGGENPEWNHPIRLYFDTDRPTDNNSPDLSLRFDIRTQVLHVDKLVGSVDVPIVALAPHDGPTGSLQHVTYQVIGTDGAKVNGFLSFSYILNDAPARISSDHPPVQDPVTLHQGTSYQSPCNDMEHQKVYPAVEKTDTKSRRLYPTVVERDLKPQLYPTVDTFENVDDKRFVYPSLAPDPSAQVYPPPSPVLESKQSLYPVVSTEPVIAYPVLDPRYPQCPSSLGSYPRVEPAVGLASYASPGGYPPPQSPGYYHGWEQSPGYYHGWDGRY